MPKLSDMWMSTECSKQRGASALEASVAVVPVLLVCLLGLELVHAHQVKQLASLALHEASRVASVTGADHKQVNRAFAQALAPRFAPASQVANASERQGATLARYRRLYALPLWQLEITDVRGLSSQPHAFRAVQLDLIYLHEPLQSWLRQLLKQSARWQSSNPNGLISRAQQQGLVAMRLSRKAVLHSSGVNQHPKSLLEAIPQQPQQDMNERQGSSGRQGRDPWQPRMQEPPPAPPKIQLNSIAESVGPPKALTLAPLKPEKEDLCGVLLCCAPELGGDSPFKR
jgi:hypothetical protein